MTCIQMMTSYKPDDIKSVGIEEIDLQHQRIVLLINKVEDAINVGEDPGIIKVLDELIDYVDFHFKTEERVFQLTSYPDGEIHRKEHAAFVRNVSKIMNDIEKGDPVLPGGILIFLSDWAINHIEKEDKKYAMFIADK